MSEELTKTIEALTLRIEELNKIIDEKDKEILELKSKIEELNKKLEEPVQFTEKIDVKGDAYSIFTPADVIIEARKKGII